ncbi:MAG: alanine--glyoxylate aminotransferase family protein [bacterium]|nr:alanine--glyoxylate aminotransferase family protein [bacterium]
MTSPLAPPDRLLLGPGPSPVAPSVLDALGKPVIGHLDPEFIRIMDETSEQLRAVFRTSNPLTFPVSGTGSAGMETALVNVLEPGDVIVIGVNGVFGGRMADAAARAGAVVTTVEARWGDIVDPVQLGNAATAANAKVVALVHAETSTGVRSPVDQVRNAIGPDPLLLVDSVTGLAGIPLEVDGWGIDVCFSGTQKCLSVPPGLAPITFSPRAANVVAERKTSVQSWYLDVSMLRKYWEEGQGARAYHHTAPISMVYGLWEGLRLVMEEGLETRWARHQDAGDFLQDALTELGFQMFARKGYQLPQLTSVRLPADVPDSLRGNLLHEFGIEIGGGLGEGAGKVWRIGLMGHGATRHNAERLIESLRALL